MAVRIAVALLVRDNRILLAHRTPTRHAYPNCWDLPGGHIEPTESPRQAVIRECHEELAIHIHNPTTMPLKITDPTLEVHAFLVTHWTGTPTNAAPEEHDDLRWFHPTDLPSLPLAHQNLPAAVCHSMPRSNQP